MSDCYYDDDGCLVCPEHEAVARSSAHVDRKTVLAWNAGANSATVRDGDLRVAWDMPDPVVGAIVGLKSAREAQTVPSLIEHGWYFQTQYGARLAQPIERGMPVGAPVTNYALASMFEVRRAGDQVSYLVDSAPHHASERPSSGPKVVNSCLFATGDEVPSEGADTAGEVRYAPVIRPESHPVIASGSVVQNVDRYSQFLVYVAPSDFGATITVALSAAAAPPYLPGGSHLFAYVNVSHYDTTYNGLSSDTGANSTIALLTTAAAPFLTRYDVDTVNSGAWYLLSVNSDYVISALGVALGVTVTYKQPPSGANPPADYPVVGLGALTQNVSDGDVFLVFVPEGANKKLVLTASVDSFPDTDNPSFECDVFTQDPSGSDAPDFSDFHAFCSPPDTQGSAASILPAVGWYYVKAYASPTSFGGAFTLQLEDYTPPVDTEIVSGVEQSVTFDVSGTSYTSDPCFYIDVPEGAGNLLVVLTPPPGDPAHVSMGVNYGTKPTGEYADSNPLQWSGLTFDGAAGAGIPNAGPVDFQLSFDTPQAGRWYVVLDVSAASSEPYTLTATVT